MLKLTSLALGLLTVLAMAPSSQAAITPDRALTLQRLAGEINSSAILTVAENRRFERREHLHNRRERRIVHRLERRERRLEGRAHRIERREHRIERRHRI